ncbi:multidrug effflux MFS transporter [Flagellimonas sp. HMM57]|uniref:multidrug effflux MFS transporter n=1 Tax=unclassified Flagellimonas TaxID=2644544 RepID=UPI0013D4582B|nr:MULTISPECIES: multidrug effflux MFS transporter [unclassified Flagellimonas]UII75300.1 multidrug effflux MFS transporter [Flagellimonas sp. HMM57]
MQKENQKPNFEFIALMAALMSIVALSIDALLPAIPNIGEAIKSTDATDNQMLITMIFLGLGVGQLFFGPLSDCYGRKPVVYLGMLVFGIASVICIVAPSLEWMVFGRILQGIGLSTARTIAIAIIRDTYKGDYMARVMSFVTAFFILVPIVAPAIGKVILDAFNWQAIFYMQLGCTFLVGVWFWKRQPETLRPEYKIPITTHMFTDGLKEFLRYRETVAFTFVSGLVTGAFLVYLSASQHIFEDLYNLKDTFPYIFAGLSVSIGLSTFSNGKLVLRFGMRKLSFMALIAFCGNATLFVLLFWGSPNPSVFILVIFLFLQFFCLGFMWGNFRSIAMEPIGHIAGIGAAINGFVSTVISVPIASFIGNFVEDRVLPLFIGLALCGFASLAIFMMIKKTKRLVTSKS